MKDPKLTKTRSLLVKVRSFIHYIRHFWTIVKFRGFQKALKKAITDQEVDKIILKDIIIKDMRKALRIDAKSKFIPDDIRNRAEIKEMVLGRHGEKMKALNLTITDDLILK